MQKIFLLLLATLLLLSGFNVGVSRAQSVVLLPVADTSNDYNGVDLDITAVLYGLLADAGLQLVEDTAVRSFMAANRLRYSGVIDSFATRKMGRELGADIVLLTTLCENGAPGKKRFGLVLTALETVNGEVVWSAQDSSSLLQETALFGVGEPLDGPDLKLRILQLLAERTADELPLIVPLLPSGAHQLKLVDIQIEPEFLRGGESVKCQLELESLGEMPKRVVLKNCGGEVDLVPGKSMGEFNGRWRALADEGEYKLSLTFMNESGDQITTISDVAKYTVFNRAPQLLVELKQGLAVNDVTIFRERLLISSRLQPKRLVSRWQVKVIRSDGRVMVDDNMDGELPCDLVWTGCNNKRQRLPDGEYDLLVKIWDAAGNQAEASRKVSILSECQPIEVKTVRKGKKNFVHIKIFMLFLIYS
ncbi:hypothetical protein KAI46_11200 [bacterium]|nr:hypothetical protein [bacterium]